MTTYGRYWDGFVERWQADPALARRYAWPGDEWGSQTGWDSLFRSLLVPAGVESWRKAVEIGPGSGKYTEMVLASGDASVRAYDVSAAFLAVCNERCRPRVDEGRLALVLLGGTRPAELLQDVRASGWERDVDAVYSIDAMVHVDLQHLVVYLLTAALTLRPGGKLVLTLADATRDPGFTKLLEDVAWTYEQQASPIGSGKFEWLSPDLVRAVLTRLGFALEVLDDRQRDLRVTATLVDPAAADALAHHVEPRAERDRVEGVRHVRTAVRACVPPGAVVAVVSKGDEDLVELDGCVGRHLPETAAGDYAGYHPADTDEALARIEAARARGARYLVLPHAAFWWLEFYAGLPQGLDARHRRVWDDDVCVIWELA